MKKNGHDAWWEMWRNFQSEIDRFVVRTIWKQLKKLDRTKEG